MISVKRLPNVIASVTLSVSFVKDSKRDRTRTEQQCQRRHRTVYAGSPEFRHPAFVSATSRDLLCEMVDHLTAKVVTDATFHFLSGEQTSWFNNGPFAMHPMRLNAVEPGTFGRQPARNDAHSCMALTLGCQHAAIVLLEPTAHFLTHMPGGVIPDEDQYALALALHLLAEPL